MSAWEPTPDDWDAERAQSMIGAIVLIGITCVDPDGHRQQMFGRILSVNLADGFEVELLGQRAGERYQLPPELSAFSEADEGDYHLRSTGEVVVNPDFIASWTIHLPE